MTDAPDYAKLVEELNNFADTLDNDAEDARAAEAEEAQANAEEWAALQRTSAAAITALLRERDEALAVLAMRPAFSVAIAEARTAALEEAAKVALEQTYAQQIDARSADIIAAAIRALAKPE